MFYSLLSLYVCYVVCCMYSCCVCNALYPFSVLFFLFNRYCAFRRAGSWGVGCCLNVIVWWGHVVLQWFGAMLGQLLPLYAASTFVIMLAPLQSARAGDTPCTAHTCHTHIQRTHLHAHANVETQMFVLFTWVGLPSNSQSIVGPALKMHVVCYMF